MATDQSTERDQSIGAPPSFQNTVAEHLAGAYISAMCYLGDRLGLFQDLAQNGPATSVEFARRSGLMERYVREWLHALGSAAYLAYDASQDRFSLPDEHRAVLADENHPLFQGGMFQVVAAEMQVVDQVSRAFRDGGGVPLTAYSVDLWDGEARFSAARYRASLLSSWLPRLPGVVEALQRGASVADVGCGEGYVLMLLAEAYPNSRYVGFDPSEMAIRRARERAEAEGLADRVTFLEMDPAAALPEQFDIITTFTVVHDAAFPEELLKRIREALRPDGVYICRDIAGRERFDPAGGMDALACYAESVLYCLTTALAEGGEGLGTLGLSEERFRRLCHAAGFRTIRRVEIDDPFANLYEVTP